MRPTTSGNSSASSCSSLACSRSRASTSLATITAWAEEGVRALHVERQVEADRAAADVGAPALDVLVLGRAPRRAARPAASVAIDRCVLRQRQVDQELGPVGGREELRRHEAAAGRPPPRTRPIVTAIVSQRARIAPTSRLAVPPHERARRLRRALTSLGAFRIAMPSSGAKITATSQETISAMRDHREDREGVLARRAPREADRHEARDRDQRAGQHRRGERACRRRSPRLPCCRPAARRRIIASTVVIASSTSSVSAMISAPSEIRCRSMPTNSA